MRKPACALPCIICDSAHNSRKTQLYTHLAYKSKPSVFMCCDSAHNSSFYAMWNLILHKKFEFVMNPSNLRSQPNYYLSLCSIWIIHGTH